MPLRWKLSSGASMKKTGSIRRSDGSRSGCYLNSRDRKRSVIPPDRRRESGGVEGPPGAIRKAVWAAARGGPPVAAIAPDLRSRHRGVLVPCVIVLVLWPGPSPPAHLKIVF